MRRAASLALVALAACSSKSASSRNLHDRCADALAHPEQLDAPYQVARFANACADQLPDGPCRQILHYVDQYTPDEFMKTFHEVCLNSGDADADAAPAVPAGPARLLLHQAEAELIWHGLDLHLSKDCRTLGVAIDTANTGGTLVLVVDKDVLYPDVNDALHCMKLHVSDVTLQEAP